MDPAFLDLMPHTITHEPPTGVRDEYGHPTFGAAVSYRCYIEPTRGNEIVRLTDGQDRFARYHIYVNSTVALDPEGRLTLPSGYFPQQPKILACSLYSDENGPHHVKLTI